MLVRHIQLAEKIEISSLFSFHYLVILSKIDIFFILLVTDM
ncbi:hypothetical protein K710_1653 [Streptococcus iniae SF1]|nr:hypothetical protein K710_1653 [Streptococcus iniae SF1]